MLYRFFSSALLFIILIHRFTFSQWQAYQVSSSGIRFYDVCVVNNNTLWCSGDSGRVYRTTNGGIFWILASLGLPLSPVLKITAVDSLRAWIYLSNNRLFRTVDGGMNWIEQFYSPLTYVNKLHFFNSNTGYMIGDPLSGSDTALFFITRNGGQNWIRMANSPRIQDYFMRDNGANHLDTNFLWFVAKKGSVSRFYKLTGGLNNLWQYYDISICPCDMAVFENNNEGLMVDALNVYQTTNGGLNWTLKITGPLVGPTNDFMFVPGSNWVIHNSPSALRMSYDFCNSWQPLVNHSMLGYSDARDTNSVWIASSGGQLLKHNFSFIGLGPISDLIPSAYKLYQNYPNPFNPVTNIKFDLPVNSYVTLSIYDLTGSQVAKLVDQKLSSGTYSIRWDASDYSSGIYFYMMQSGEFSSMLKMVLLK